MKATTESTIINVMGMLGLVLIVSSLMSGRYLLPTLAFLVAVGFGVYEWWVRKTPPPT
jgi:hypothetical protein